MSALPGYLRVVAVRRADGGGLEYDIAWRTWHPSWWWACWTLAVEVALEIHDESDVPPLVCFLIALRVWVLLLAHTVRL